MGGAMIPAEASLDGVPDEILSKIGEELWLVSLRPALREIPGMFDEDEPEARDEIQRRMHQVRRAAWKGLRSLSMTNKRCNRTVRRFLYHSIDLVHVDPAKPVDAPKLILRLLEDRSIAEMVRRMNFECEFVWKGDGARTLKNMIVIEHLGGGALAERAWDMLGESARYLIILESLLLRMKNLQWLAFDPDCDIETTQQLVILPGANLHTVLPNLRCLKYYNDWGTEESRTTSAHDFLCRTQVAGFLIQALTDLKGISTRGTGVFPTQIQYLNLDHCLFSATALEQLLKCCPNIEYFCYVVGFAEIEESETSLDERATAADAVRSLQRYCKSLEILHLNLTGHWYRDGHQDVPGYVLESETVQNLSGMKSLKDLFINRFDLTPALKGDFAEINLDNGDSQTDPPVHEQNMPTEPSDFLDKLPDGLEYFRITNITKSVAPVLKKNSRVDQVWTIA